MKYPQPYTIRNQLRRLEREVEINPALKEQMIDYEHNKSKRMKKYTDSKYFRRMK